MESISAGDGVTVSGDMPKRDGIVFDTPGMTKTVVAVGDRGRGHTRAVMHRTTGK